MSKEVYCYETPFLCGSPGRRFAFERRTPLPAASAAFSDAEGTWAAEVIEKAEGYGLMNGYPDGTFGVGKELTRGEFVAVLCRMFGWDAASPGAPSFSDCPASHWAYSYVETALALA